MCMAAYVDDVTPIIQWPCAWRRQPGVDARARVRRLYAHRRAPQRQGDGRGIRIDRRWRAGNPVHASRRCESAVAPSPSGVDSIMTNSISHPPVRPSRARSRGSRSRCDDHRQRSTSGHRTRLSRASISRFKNGRSPSSLRQANDGTPTARRLAAACSIKERCFEWTTRPAFSLRCIAFPDPTMTSCRLAWCAHRTGVLRDDHNGEFGCERYSASRQAVG